MLPNGQLLVNDSPLDSIILSIFNSSNSSHSSLGFGVLTPMSILVWTMRAWCSNQVGVGYKVFWHKPFGILFCSSSLNFSSNFFHGSVSSLSSIDLSIFLSIWSLPYHSETWNHPLTPSNIVLSILFFNSVISLNVSLINLSNS